VPADPVAVARALAGAPGFAFLWDASSGGPSYVTCDPIARSSALDPEPALKLDGEAAPLLSVPRWIGLLPYEARRSLERPAWTRFPEDRPSPHVVEPLWRRYGAVARVAEDVLVVGDDPERVSSLAARIRASKRDSGEVRVDLAFAEPDSVHRERIVRALELIVEGQIYQVNLARRFEFSARGHVLDLLERLVRHARAPHSAAFEIDGLDVVASSPELFLSVDARGRVLTEPIKGTRPRGRDAGTDALLAHELDHDPKERAELAMVVDVERNDLGRVARVGTVRVRGNPRIRTFGSVHHRVATVTADLRRGIDRSTLLEAMLPSGSITGAPKIRAMEVIAKLESARRGLYTGAFGALGHDGSLRLAMAIRTLTRLGEAAHYFAGGGIVADSDPTKEVLETEWKASQIRRLLASNGSPRG